MKFNKKIALITGGSRGLGKNTALRLAGYGADSVITYHSRKEEADSVVSEIEAKDQRAVALQLDGGGQCHHQVGPQNFGVSKPLQLRRNNILQVGVNYVYQRSVLGLQTGIF